MIHILHHLNYVPVLIVTVIGFVFGGLWYSKLLFCNAWRAETKLTEEQCKAGSFKKMLVAFLATFVLSAVIDSFLVLRGTEGLLGGAKMGLLIGVGIVAVTQGPAALFEGRTCKYRAIVIGHNVLLCVLVAALLGAYR
jgi:UDP-N-acetylmuramyl pentapeptide phosphotransferase/UDP-N-acetylglucosamine-1-phosphate transferase